MSLDDHQLLLVRMNILSMCFTPFFFAFDVCALLKMHFFFSDRVTCFDNFLGSVKELNWFLLSHRMNMCEGSEREPHAL